MFTTDGLGIVPMLPQSLKKLILQGVQLLRLLTGIEEASNCHKNPWHTVSKITSQKQANISRPSDFFGGGGIASNAQELVLALQPGIILEVLGDTGILGIEASLAVCKAGTLPYVLLL